MTNQIQVLQGCILALTLALFAGCATNNDQYYWGNYESLVYDMYAKPGEADPVMQIEKLTTDIEQAENNGKPVPPGVHAHLGMMHAMAGNAEDAMAAFTIEKTLYPESAVLIDGMIARANNQGQN